MPFLRVGIVINLLFGFFNSSPPKKIHAFNIWGAQTLSLLTGCKISYFLLYKQFEWQVLDLEVMRQDREVNSRNYKKGSSLSLNVSWNSGSVKSIESTA